MPMSSMGFKWRNLIPAFRTADSARLKQNIPEIGDRFYEVAPPHHIWRVDRLVRSSICDIPHVIIERSGTIAASKIISLAVLLDKSCFKPDRRSTDGDQTASEKRRRKNDIPLAGEGH